MAENKTQNQLIKDALDAGRTITALEALDEFGCFRLASRISDLKKSGYPIHKGWYRTKSGKDIAAYSKAV